LGESSGPRLLGHTDSTVSAVWIIPGGWFMVTDDGLAVAPEETQLCLPEQSPN
jgi:hypothetical protein